MAHLRAAAISEAHWWLCPVALMVLVSAIVKPALPMQDTSGVRSAMDSVLFRFVDTDLRAVIQTMIPYVTKPVLVAPFEPRTVSFETPLPIPAGQVAAMLRELVESQGLELREDEFFIHVSQPAGTVTPEGGTTPTQLFVLRLKHARAANVAATLNQIFGVAGPFANGSGLSGGTLADELRRDAGSDAEEAGQTSMTSESTADLVGPVTIVPDELTNSLLIRAAPDDMSTLEGAVQELDLRPLQVLIQVLIVEVRRDRALNIGVSAAVEGVELDGKTDLSATLLGGGLGDFVVQVMRIGAFDLDAVVTAAVRRGDAKIVSRPVLVTSNNREARILVGSQRPFVQISRSLPTDTPSRDQVVQYRDVGTKLSVLPTINNDGYVSLVVRQEVNAATNETQFDAPVISTREAETDVLVRDGQTIVIGGMRERQHEVVKSGIPVLSAIPLLGGLFGVQDRRTTETELFLFITPRVLRDDAAVDAAALEALEQVNQSGIQLDSTGVRR